MTPGFDKLEPGMAVSYIASEGDNGPVASRVWTGAEPPGA
jgi:hypothetical protein